MEVFDINPLIDTEVVVPKNDRDLDIYIFELTGKALAHKWVPIEVRVIKTGEKGERLKEYDIPWLGSRALVVRRRAYELLQPVLSQDGEFLELQCATDKLWLFNCTNNIHALDMSQSEIEYIVDGVPDVTKYVFHSDIIGESLLFSIPALMSDTLYATPAFVKLIKQLKITGIEFHKLWEG
jgi:hypothetical protein